MRLTRRSMTAGLGWALAPAAARAEARWAIPDAARSAPGAVRWRLREDGPRLDLGLTVETEAGVRPFSAVLAGRPALVSLWASWCPPCLVEKPHLDALAARLATAPIAVLALMAFDESRAVAVARAKHDRLGLKMLAPLAAGGALERAIARDLLQSRARRPLLPRTLLLAPDGRLIGAVGAAILSEPTPRNLWREPETETFLRALAG